MTTKRLGLRRAIGIAALCLATTEAREAWAWPPQSAPSVRRGGYSLPWGLRPAIAPNLLRLDTAIVPRMGTGQGVTPSTPAGTNLTFTFTGGYKPIRSVPDLGFYLRVAAVHDSPDGASGASGVSNPMLFALWSPELRPSLRLALFAGVAIPVGAGGGAAPDLTVRSAMTQGLWSRSAMDNALFSTNYLTLAPGVGVAWVRDGLTLQAEVTVLQLVRVREGFNGAVTPARSVDPDEMRTNLVLGAHVGYRVLPALTVSAELRYQRWLTTPAAVAADEALRHALTVGGGVRANIPLSAQYVFRPGVAYFHPLVGNMSRAGHRVIIVDLAFPF